MIIIFMLEFQEMAGEHLHVNVFIQEVMYLYTQGELEKAAKELSQPFKFNIMKGHIYNTW